MTTAAAPAPPAFASSDLLRTLGQRYAHDAAVRAFFEGGGHRRAQWVSPGVEAPRLPLHATLLTENPASGGALVPPDYQAPPTSPLAVRPIVVSDLCAPGSTGSNAIVYPQEVSFTNAADAVVEGGTKPESAMVFTSVTQPVRKIAHVLPVTEELLDDAAGLASFIDAQMRYGLDLVEDVELLTGSGTAPHLRGFLNQPGLAAPIAVSGGATNADAVLSQIFAIWTATGIRPTGVVMNPANVTPIATAKTAQGTYVSGSTPLGPGALNTLWGLPLAVTSAMPLGTALVGAFATMSQVFLRGGDRVETSNSHSDYFVKNKISVRAERRLALAVYRPACFGTCTGLT